MAILKLILYFLTGILTSFYLFPIEFVFAPGINTKMVMAAFGIILFMVEFAKKRELSLNKGFIMILIWGFIVSIIGFLSLSINNTQDYAYATYFVSMFVWLGGAYTLLTTIKNVHGNISVRLVCNYLIAVSVGQCASAMLMEYIPAFRTLINSIVLGVGFSKDFADLAGDRVYGIGAVLDVAGQRFSCILLMIACLVTSPEVEKSIKSLFLYIVSFLFIAVIGNMIGRTTTVGMLLSLGYWLLFFVFSREHKTNLFKVLCIVFIVGIPAVVLLYNTNVIFYCKIRFGFEGFFSLFETGQWDTNSTEILQNMYRWPDSLRTWLIGDGYFDNPTHDPHYIGHLWKGFYQGTDVGYLRFIYYFGIFGLIAFSLYFIRIGLYLHFKQPEYRIMFWGLVLINFIVWFKVSSDIFSILALFLLLPSSEESEEIDDTADISETA